MSGAARDHPGRQGLPCYAVIMAGGQGTRFWPRSRRRVPKQLLSLTGRTTLLQDTAQRLRPLFGWRRMLVVTNAEHAAAVRRQLPSVPVDQILVEPMGRNTLPCIALAAEWITTRVADALMVIVPADHAIKDASGLRRSLKAACDLAAQRDCLVTIGVQPTRAETGYGYIEIGEAVDGGGRETCWVRRFHEKPSSPVAKRYVASGRHLWNSGMFVWKTSVFRQAVALCVPAIPRLMNGLWRSPRGRRERLRRAYRKLPSVSVDVAVMQPISAQAASTPRVAVLRLDCDWNDVGSWEAVPELWGRDESENAALGKMLAIDAKGCIVYAPDRLVVLVGVNDLIVVDSKDALLVCARDRAQDVRQVAVELKRRGWTQYL